MFATWRINLSAKHVPSSMEFAQTFTILRFPINRHASAQTSIKAFAAESTNQHVTFALITIKRFALQQKQTPLAIAICTAPPIFVH